MLIRNLVGWVELKESNHRNDEDEDQHAFEPLTYDQVLVYQEDITGQAR